MPVDFIEDAAPESGGIDFVPEEAPGTVEGVGNSMRRGFLAGQRAIETAALSTDRGGATVGQGRAAFERAMLDPQYQSRLATEDPARVESLFGPGRRLGQIRGPIEAGRTALAQDIATGTRKIEAIPQSAAMQEWAAADNSNWWEVFARNPVEITANIFAESIPQSAVGMAGGIAAGAAGGPVGAAAGAGTGSFIVEASNALLEGAQQSGVDLREPEQVRAFFADENKVKEAKAFAVKRGFPVALFDALTAGVAGKFLKPMLGKGVLRVGAGTAAELTTQMAGGAAGETAAQLATGQPLSAKEIFAEAAGELVTAPSEVITNLRGELTKPGGIDFVADSNGQPETSVPPRGPTLGAAAPVAAPANTSPQGLKDLEAALRGNQLKRAPAPPQKPAQLTGEPLTPDEAAGDESVRKFLAERGKDYSGMNGFELQLLEDMGDAGARSERKARATKKWQAEQSGAKVGSPGANVGSESANVGSEVAKVGSASVDFTADDSGSALPQPVVEPGRRAVQVQGAEIAGEEERAAQPPRPVEDYQGETGSGYTIADVAKENGGIGAPKLDWALRRMTEDNRTAAQVVAEWSGGRGEADGLAGVIEEIRVAAEAGRQHAAFRQLAEAYRRAFREGGSTRIDQTLDGIAESERTGFTADGGRVRSAEDLIGRAWDHATGRGQAKALTGEAAGLRFNDVAASSTGRSATQNGGAGLDVAQLQQGDRFKIRDTGYEVARIEADGSALLRATGEGRGNPEQFGGKPVLNPAVARRFYPDRGSFQPGHQTSNVPRIDGGAAPGQNASRELPRTAEERAVADLNRSLARAGAGAGQVVVVPRGELQRASSAARGREAGWRAFEKAFRRRIIVVRGAAGRLPFQGVVIPGHPDTIFLNEDRANGEAVLGHEFTESLALENPELFERLRAELRPLMAKLPEYQARLNALERSHGLKESDTRAAERELIADFIGDLLARPEFLTKLRESNPSLFQQVANALLKFLRDVREALRPYGAHLFLRDVEAAEARVMAALEEHAAGGKGGVQDAAEDKEQRNSLDPEPAKSNMATISARDSKGNPVEITLPAEEAHRRLSRRKTLLELLLDCMKGKA